MKKDGPNTENKFHAILRLATNMASNHQVLSVTVKVIATRITVSMLLTFSKLQYSTIKLCDPNKPSNNK